MLGAQIEERDHSHARHDVSAAGGVGVGLLLEVAVDGGADVERARFDPEGVDDALGVRERVGARRAVGHPDADHVLRAEGAGGERRDDRGIDAAGHADDGFLETASVELVLQERDEPGFEQGGVDFERRRRAAGEIAAGDY